MMDNALERGWLRSRKSSDGPVSRTSAYRNPNGQSVPSNLTMWYCRIPTEDEVVGMVLVVVATVNSQFKFAVGL